MIIWILMTLIAYLLCGLLGYFWIKSDTLLRKAEERTDKLLAVMGLYSDDNLVMVGEIARLLREENALLNMSCRISPEIDKHGHVLLHTTIHNSYNSVTHHFSNLSDAVSFLYSRVGT